MQIFWLLKFLPQMGAGGTNRNFLMRHHAWFSISLISFRLYFIKKKKKKGLKTSKGSEASFKILEYSQLMFFDSWNPFSEWFWPCTIFLGPLVWYLLVSHLIIPPYPNHTPAFCPEIILEIDSKGEFFSLLWYRTRNFLPIWDELFHPFFLFFFNEITLYISKEFERSKNIHSDISSIVSKNYKFRSHPLPRGSSFGLTVGVIN